MKNKNSDNKTVMPKRNSGTTRRDILYAGGALAAAGIGSLASGNASAASKKKQKKKKKKAPPFQTQAFGNYYPQDGFTPEVDLAGKMAVVTGASRGIGLATAEALIARGVNVIGTSRDIMTIPGGGSMDVDYRNLDIADSASIDTFIAGLPGPIDILINNAGRFVIGANVPLPSTPIGFYLDAIALGVRTLYTGPLELTNKMLGYMSALAAGSSYSRILFTVSSVGQTVGGTDFSEVNQGASFFHAYTSGKRALLAYANGLRATLRTSTFPPLNNIKVSTVNPVLINTDLADDDRILFTDSDPSLYKMLLLDPLQAAFSVGVPASLVGSAYAQLLESNDPAPNVVAGSKDEPLATQGFNAVLEQALVLENEEAAYTMGCAPPGQS